jgi:tRNA uracil 4-sulfurtransferase
MMGVSAEEGLFLVKYGEIALKKGNRGAFLRRLKRSIAAKMPDLEVRITEVWHRLYVMFRAGDEARVRAVLEKTYGIVAFCRAVAVDKDMDAIASAAVTLAEGLIRAGVGTRFKAEVRRADKRFPLRSYQIACRIGDELLARFPQLSVDVHAPQWTVRVEIRERAYVYGPETRGPSGLPSGSSGMGILLLSGGIDSPVAGYRMGMRGLALEAVYFHSPPFTTEKAREKALLLARILGPYIPGLVLHVVPLTAALARIKERAKEEETTLLMRACMMRLATMIAERRGGQCLVTGESLGQVASQTVESMRFTESFSGPPVFRPLIGMNKEEIVDEARRIGTFETSNLPYADCCSLFSPPHPLIHPQFDRMRRAYEELEMEPILLECLGKMESEAV